MRDVVLKNPARLTERLALDSAQSLLLVDSPPSLELLLRAGRPPERAPATVRTEAIRSVKKSFAAILAWREDRAGSRSLFEALVKRLESSGVLWIVTAMKKVSGPATPGSRRLERSDLEKAFATEGFVCDREVRLTAWHVAYRFSRLKT